MPILRTSKSKWIAGISALVVISVGTLIGTPTNGKIHHIPLNMKATSSKADFAPITPNGVVPNNVFQALLVPSNSTRTGWVNYDQNNGTYDRQVNISVPVNFESTKTFFIDSLLDNAWKILSRRNTSSGYQILALHAGNDGHFWEIGVTVLNKAPAVPSLTSGKSANGPTGTNTSVTLRLLQYESA
ncbi:MAG: hypothetical protein M1288_02810 [Actinobacteria bacterium]|nr:hypothetical protein [Actinomycetota bacterium]